jgi:hypothetical protein
MNSDEAPATLIEACPGIEPAWQEHLDFWSGPVPLMILPLSSTTSSILEKRVKPRLFHRCSQPLNIASVSQMRMPGD